MPGPVVATPGGGGGQILPRPGHADPGGGHGRSHPRPGSLPRAGGRRHRGRRDVGARTTHGRRGETAPRPCSRQQGPGRWRAQELPGGVSGAARGAPALPGGPPARSEPGGRLLRGRALQLFPGAVAGPPEEKYAEALQLGRDLLQRYPGNPDLYFATAHAASELGRTDEALEIARRLSRNMAEGRPHFTPDLSARFNQLMGKIYMDHGEYATALTFFQRAVQAPTPVRYRWVTAWAWTRSGMVHDLQGDREEAVRRYRKALAVEAEGIAKDLARRYLETPYRGRTRPAS
ncbi:MAG: tetratricopeptide repeat protein [candidate division NC10 bacterium]|nr:tetratricopeptide repeat protein [candidate division NC10 bacterium]